MDLASELATTTNVVSLPSTNITRNTSVKVAVRIRPLSVEEKSEDSALCIHIVEGEPQIMAGSSNLFTYDHVFGINSSQDSIYNECVVDLINSAFEGFNATILAYGQTGSEIGRAHV
jgi:kinesin family protein 4/21/27